MTRNNLIALLTTALIAVASALPQTATADTTTRQHSLLQTGRWVKISVSQTGIYHLSDSLLRAAGFDDPARVAVYGYGGAMQPELLTPQYIAATDDLSELPTAIIGGRRVMMGIGPVNWNSPDTLYRIRNPYATRGYYFLTEKEGDEQPLLTDSATLVGQTAYTAARHHDLWEKEEYAWYKGGRNLIERKLFRQGDTRTMRLRTTSRQATLTTRLVFNGDFTIAMKVNGHALPDLTPPRGYINRTTGKLSDIYRYYKAMEATFRTDISNYIDGNVGTDGSDSITVELTLTDGNFFVRLDFLTLTCGQPVDIPMLSTAALPQPRIEGETANQDLHADSQADMVIVVPTSGKITRQAERLADLHRHYDDYRVNIVRADQLYNEFSSGTPDANAYRRYLKMLYDRADNESERPRFLVLFGDGAWDNRLVSDGWQTTEADDLLLCYESENSYSETECYVTDDYFTILEDNRGDNLTKTDLSDCAVGRLPARTEEQAKILVDKIESYISNEQAGPWQNLICMMGDDGNQNMHMEDAEVVTKVINDNFDHFNIRKIYWDAYPMQQKADGNRYADVQHAIRQQITDGALMMNYTGHGAPISLSHEMVLLSEDFTRATSLRLPMWITASCDIMPFDGQSANIGETAMLNPQGGAIAFLGTTRTVYARYNQYMNRTVVRHLFGQTDGRRNAIGEAVRLAKRELMTIKTGGDRTTNKLQYTLLGDPALVLAAPTMRIVIDSINGIPTDTTGKGTMLLPVKLEAGRMARIQGHIEGADDFSGSLALTVREAEQVITGRQNQRSEADTAIVFRDRPLTVYQGNDTVVNGRFSASLLIPLDISYTDGEGLIVAYAVDNEHRRSAHGTQTGFTMVSEHYSPADGQGPQISIMLDGSDYSEGMELTSIAPSLSITLADDNGINAAGSGIGHDIEMRIDGRPDLTYTLNSSFRFDNGDYRRGTVDTMLPDMTLGAHTLAIRAWDIVNNPSEALFTFAIVPANTHVAGIEEVSTHTTTAASATYDLTGRIIANDNREAARTTVRRQIVITRDSNGHMRKVFF